MTIYYIKFLETIMTFKRNFSTAFPETATIDAKICQILISREKTLQIFRESGRKPFPLAESTRGNNSRRIFRRCTLTYRIARTITLVATKAIYIHIYNAFRYTYAHLRVFSRLLSPFSRSWLKMIVPGLKASRSLKSPRHYFEPPTGRSLCHKGRDSLLHFETYE